VEELEIKSRYSVSCVRTFLPATLSSKTEERLAPARGGHARTHMLSGPIAVDHDFVIPEFRAECQRIIDTDVLTPADCKEEFLFLIGVFGVLGSLFTRHPVQCVQCVRNRLKTMQEEATVWTILAYASEAFLKQQG